MPNSDDIDGPKKGALKATSKFPETTPGGEDGTPGGEINPKENDLLERSKKKLKKEKKAEQNKKDFSDSTYQRKMRKFIKHIFTKHLTNENSKDFRIKLLKIFFTYKILKNNYMAHFLLNEFQSTGSKDNFIKKNYKLLN